MTSSGEGQAAYSSKVSDEWVYMVMGKALTRQKPISTVVERGFEKELHEGEVNWGYISTDFRQREILGREFTITYSNKMYTLHLNKAGRIVTKELIQDLRAKPGMKLIFKFEKPGSFSLAIA